MAMDSSFARQVEHLDRQRDRSLAWFLGCFLFWVASTMVLTVAVVRLGFAGRAVGPYLLLTLALAPFLLWFFFLGRYFWIQLRIRSDPRLAEALNDELVRAAWLKAAAAGFWTMLAAEVLLTLARLLTNIVIAMGLLPWTAGMFNELRSPLVLALGIGVTVGVYLHQRREG